MCFAKISNQDGIVVSQFMGALLNGIECLSFRQREQEGREVNREEILGISFPFHMLKISEQSTR